MLVIDLIPFPELTTERLILRQITINDAEAAFNIRTHPEVNKFLDPPLSKTFEDVLNWIQATNVKIQNNECVIWGICAKETPQLLLGAIGFWRIQKEHYRAEIGYFIHPSEQGKGYVSEAIHEIIQYGFEVLNLHSVEAHIDPLNIASSRVIEKLGFVREAYFKENNFFKGKFRDTAIYSLLTTVKKPVVEKKVNI